MKPRDKYVSTFVERWIPFVVISIFGLLVGINYTEIESKGLATTIVILYLLMIFIFVGLSEITRIRQKQATKQVDYWKGRQEKSEKKVTDLTRSRRTLILTTQSKKIEHHMKNIIKKYHEIKKIPNSTISKDDINNQKRFVLRSICESIQSDSIITDETDYFKATLYKVKTNNLLCIDQAYYPPGLHVNTKEIIRDLWPRATSFKCLDTQNVQIVQNVPDAFSNRKNGNWVAFYTGQEDKYGSMISAPISLGERTKDTYQIVAILTIDTNMLNYFIDTETQKYFWSVFLAPFRAYLSLLYLIETEFNNASDKPVVEKVSSEVPQQDTLQDKKIPSPPITKEEL